MALRTLMYVAGSASEFQLPDHTQLLLEALTDSIKLWMVEVTGSPGETLWELSFPPGFELDQTSELAKNILDLALKSLGDCETLDDVHKQLSTVTAPLLNHYLRNNAAENEPAAPAEKESGAEPSPVAAASEADDAEPKDESPQPKPRARLRSILSLPWVPTPLKYAVILFALIFPWHIAVASRMEDSVVFRDGERSYAVAINPLTDIVTIKVAAAESPGESSSTSPADEAALNRVIGSLLLESDLKKRARRAFDIYAMLIPYSLAIGVEPVKESGLAATHTRQDDEVHAPETQSTADDQGKESQAEEVDRADATAPGPGEAEQATAPVAGGADGASATESEPRGAGEAKVREAGEAAGAKLAASRRREDPPATSIKLAIQAPQPQVGTVGTALPTPIKVQVTDQLNRPMAGHLVNFVVVRGGGSVSSGSALTDPQGMAAESWTLGTRAGEQRLEVRAQGPDGQRKTETFRARATPGPVASREFELPDTINLFLNERLSFADKIRMADGYGNQIDPSNSDFTLSVPEGVVVEDGPAIWTALELRGSLTFRPDRSAAAVQVPLRSFYDVTQHPWRYVVGESSCEPKNPADSTLVVFDSVTAEYLPDSPAGLPGDGLPIVFSYPQVRREITWWNYGSVDTVEVGGRFNGSRLLAKQSRPDTLYLSRFWQEVAVVQDSPRTYLQRRDESCPDGSRAFQSRTLVATP